MGTADPIANFTVAVNERLPITLIATNCAGELGVNVPV